VQWTATYNGVMSISPWMVLVIGFALGSIPFGVLMGKLRGVDIQATGSGNIGATNAIRSMGKGPGIIVFILDALKGAVPVLIAKAAHTEPSWFVYAGLLAIVGHIFSPWVRFKGGKGAATGLGVLFGLDLPLALGTFVLFILAFVVSGKRVSVGSMVAALGQAAVVWFLPERTLAEKLLCTGIAVFILVRHKDNIERLIKGEEKPLDLK